MTGERKPPGLFGPGPPPSATGPDGGGMVGIICEDPPEESARLL